MNLTNLQILDISENNIEEIPKDIGNLQKLKCFYMKKNPIKSMPYELLRLEKLSEFEVEEKFLKRIDPMKEFFSSSPYHHGVFARIKGAKWPKIENRNSYSMAW